MELFATFDDEGNPTGLAPRADVHARGLWHKSAHVFLFDDEGRLLVQRRAEDKDLYGGLWDYSVGEHLQPDETFLAGAKRGLHEELGITGVAVDPLGGERRMEIRGAGHVDREIQQAFRCSYGGALRPDPEEVAEVRYIELAGLASWIAAKPDDFTPWFVEDLRHFGWLN